MKSPGIRGFLPPRCLPPCGTLLVSFALTALQPLPGQALQPGFQQSLLGTLGTESYHTRAWGLATADFNSDGHPDILAGDTAGDVHLYLGDGNGTFAHQGVVINQLYNDAYSLVAGNFDHDPSNHMDFVLARTGGATPVPGTGEGELHLYLGNGDGTFQSNGTSSPQLGTVIGVAGLDPMGLAAADVDQDGDLDLVSGERVDTLTTNDTADIILWRNQHAQGSTLSFTREILIQGVDRGFAPEPEEPPYFPPEVFLHGYGLALGDVTGDNLPDLVIGDYAHYLYIYQNTGGGTFSPIRYDNVSTGTRPYAYNRLDALINEGMPIALADFNGDGLLDIATGNAGTSDGSISLWVNEGPDGQNQPVFTGAGIIGSAGTDARGIAAISLNPLSDSYPDLVFGNLEGELHGLTTDIADTDNDGIIDELDNAPLHANAPRIDMNTDGGINYLDQLDNDNDGIGDPADDDDDNDGIADAGDNSPFTANPDQQDRDGDGVGDASDPLNNTDSDGDLITDGPFDPALRALAMDARARWSKSDTHFIIRIDALGRAFQNEFTQTMADGAILTPAEWETQKSRSYNGIGDEPADSGYTFPETDPPLTGGADCPITVVVIPRLIWNAFDDPDPIAWINERISNPNLEIGQHGAYHYNNTPLGDWKDLTDRNFYSSESAGLTLEENHQLLRVGRRSLLGQYEQDKWIMHSGVNPATAPTIDWTLAANPLISYAPPYNTSDTTGRDATARLGYRGWSASIAEESGSLSQFFSPEGSHHESFDQFGMFHASADLEVDSETPAGMPDYAAYLDSITQSPGLNTWLIEEVSWSTRYCNDLDRLVSCPTAPGGINRENNMVDPERWRNWMTLLNHAKTRGEVMTMGDYALAMQFDNAPTVPNPDQADSDHDGIGDVIDGATLAASPVSLDAPATSAEATLTATLLNSSGTGIPGQTIIFLIDTDGDGTPEEISATTGPDGVATATATVSGNDGAAFAYHATWDGGPLTASSAEIVLIGTPHPFRITGIRITTSGAVELSVEGLNPLSTYRLTRSADLTEFPTIITGGITPSGSTAIVTDPAPPETEAFYRIEQE